MAAERDDTSPSPRFARVPSLSPRFGAVYSALRVRRGPHDVGDDGKGYAKFFLKKAMVRSQAIFACASL